MQPACSSDATLCFRTNPHSLRPVSPTNTTASASSAVFEALKRIMYVLIGVSTTSTILELLFFFFLLHSVFGSLHSLVKNHN